MLAAQKIVFQNPVYNRYFADPFVWKHNGKYYAVGTGPLGTVQDIVQESDLSSRKINGRDYAISPWFPMTWCIGGFMFHAFGPTEAR